MTWEIKTYIVIDIQGNQTCPIHGSPIPVNTWNLVGNTLPAIRIPRNNTRHEVPIPSGSPEGVGGSRYWWINKIKCVNTLNFWSAHFVRVKINFKLGTRNTHRCYVSLHSHICTLQLTCYTNTHPFKFRTERYTTHLHFDKFF